MTSRGGGRGGYQQPANPAAVSNPQSGARTDGGAGSAKQPLRTPTGGEYGEAKALREQQQGAPMAAGASGAPSGPGGGGAALLAGGMGEGVFGPSASPGQPGPVADPNVMVAQHPEMFLRVLAAKFPHPAIRRLVDWSAAADNPPRETGPTPPSGNVPGLPPTSVPQPEMEGPPTTNSQRMIPQPGQPQQPTPPEPPVGRIPGLATPDTMPTPQEAVEFGP